jgi:ABC-type branched-subunit amino acid transport system substrate-binding protein
VLARAMQVAKTTDPDSVARALHTMPAYAGVTGPFAFNESGDLKSRRMVRIVVHGGRFAYADSGAPTRVAAAPAPPAAPPVP